MSVFESIYKACGQVFDGQIFFQELNKPEWDYTFRATSALTSPVVVSNKDGITATLSLDRKRTVEPSDTEKGTSRDYKYRIEGNFLTGPARIDEETGRPMAIGINVVITPHNAPTYDRQLAERIQALGTAIESALKIVTPTPKRRPKGPEAKL